MLCPSCYADCGKQAATDAGGGFQITDLDPSLHFRILVVKESLKDIGITPIHTTSRLGD